MNYLESHLLARYGDTPDNIRCLKQRFAHFKSSIKEKWSQSHRKEVVFLKTNKGWLEETFALPAIIQNRPGRPSKSFVDFSLRSKTSKTYIIIQNALLPIGQLSEEAAEARNKHFRLYRENYARKFSRKECNVDIYV